MPKAQNLANLIVFALLIVCKGTKVPTNQRFGDKYLTSGK